MRKNSNSPVTDLGAEYWGGGGGRRTTSFQVSLYTLSLYVLVLQMVFNRTKKIGEKNKKHSE